MIGHATLLTPSATTTSPASPHATPQEPHSAVRADAAHDAHRPAHEGEANGQARVDHTSPLERRSSHAQASARTARRGRDNRKEGEDTPARDAFARLLDQAPAPAEPTKSAQPAAPVAAAPDTAPSTNDTRPASLPDQLLGLLASLAPGAQAVPANAANPTPVPAQPDVSTASALPSAKPTTPPVGADAAATLLPTLQANGATASTSDATATTAAIAGALHADEASASLPALHDGTRNDTPAPTPFDALLRAPTVTAADVPRPVVPATPTPVAQPTDPRTGYGDELGSSVVWMADQRISHAEVRVVPDHLGPIDVRLQLDGAQVHATFLSAQPEVRHALEASLPRLRDLLGQHGLQLAQADVGQRQQDPRAARGNQVIANGRDANNQGDDALAPLASAMPARVMRGLLDEYA